MACVAVPETVTLDTCVGVGVIAFMCDASAAHVPGGGFFLVVGKNTQTKVAWAESFFPAISEVYYASVGNTAIVLYTSSIFQVQLLQI